MDAAAGVEQPVGFSTVDSPDVHLGYWMICAAWTGAEQDPSPLLPVPGPVSPRSRHWPVVGTELAHANGPLMRLE